MLKLCIGWVKPAEGDVVVMVELETPTPALTFLAPDEILVLVLLSLNSLPIMPSFILCSWGCLLTEEAETVPSQ